MLQGEGGDSGVGELLGFHAGGENESFRGTVTDEETLEAERVGQFGELGGGGVGGEEVAVYGCLPR